MKTFKGILAACVLCAAFMPGFAPEPSSATITGALQPDDLIGKCTSHVQCYAICGEFGGRCIFGTCYCY